MNALQIFEKDGFRVRTMILDGEPWFVAADVCKVLDIANGRDAVSRLDQDERGVASTDTPGGVQSVTVVSEAGLYALVLGSRKPEARAFKRWVTHEVLPSIRRYGVFAATIPRTLSESLRLYASALDQLEVQAKVIEEQTPKVLVAERIADATNTLTIQDFAKSLGEGPKRIYGKLAKLKIIFRNSNMDWVPYQRFIEQGYFKTHITTVPHKSGTVAHTTALLTGKGEVWLASKLSEAAS